MKVLFVGEGNHDIGPSGDEGAVRRGVHAGEGRPAGGVVTALACKVVPSIDRASSRALAWREVALITGDRKPGLDRKVKGAALLAKRTMKLDALVCVHDRDGERNAYRFADLTRGAAEVTALPVACGLAVESIEAWTLGACEALAEELGLDPASLRKHYDAARTETFLPNSGKSEKQPKAILERVTAEAHRDAGVALREAVAERTDVETLAKRCPEGFGAFREELRKKLGPPEQ
ncbi:MAG TPA: hypothetical protein VFS43_39940 [Polyangiaceae bacterium]|nr:hypothetical protein [Polyangiaceae bacterium]